MEGVRRDLVLVSDFNLTNFANILRGRSDLPWEVRVAPLDQVVTSLSDPPSTKTSAFVWTRPERISTEYQKALLYQPPDASRALAEVDAFADLLQRAAQQHHALYLPTWQARASDRFGARELDHATGVHALLARMDLHLAERLDGTTNIHRLNSTRWLQHAGENAWSDRLWYLTKTPFSNAVFQAAADDLLAVAGQLTGHAIKLIVLDLDDTLWGGIVGDDGWENLHLGGHDPAGESFVDLQRTLKGLKERGVMLAIASKNERSTALEAIAKHPEMVLRESDFVAMRIDWNDKGANVADIIRELNIGARSVMFIDDNPVERARVREFLPDVLVPEWPSNKLLYDRTLRSLPVFDLDTRSREDSRRTELYLAEAERVRSRVDHTDVETWLRSLGTVVEAKPLNDADFARVHQLFGKTNQFNLTTYRWTEKELRDRMDDPQRPVWSFRVRDRFGDAGLTGILGLDLHAPDKAVITDLVLSCRVLGRKVEETMLHVAIAQARRAGKERVEAHYLPTAKNKPCLDLLLRSGLQRTGDTFTWDTARTYEQPGTLELVMAGPIA
ncbi:MAG: HAD-IIIC family phosphatase [Flavobacteriales bacterium]|nr:HAD-IIIC family phosphatase [Flavobacteriales bacterium]